MANKKEKIDQEGRDICSVCGKDFEYGTLQDITEEGFELICPDCIRKKLAEHEPMLKFLKDACAMVDLEDPKTEVQSSVNTSRRSSKRLETGHLKYQSRLDGQNEEEESEVWGRLHY
jgi:hypothetical protein